MRRMTIMIFRPWRAMLLVAVCLLAAQLAYIPSYAIARSPALTLKDAEMENTVELYKTGDPSGDGFYLYVNEKYGYSAWIPSAITHVVTLPDNEDGLILSSGDGKARFRASGGLAEFLVGGIQGALDEACKGGMGYVRDRGETFWVIAWQYNNMVHHRKFVLDRGSWFDFEITYPASQAEQYDPLVKRMLHHFGPVSEAPATPAAKQEIVILNDVPAYASLAAAKAGEKTDITLSGLDSMPVSLVFAYTVLEEKDGWLKIDTKAFPEWETPPVDAPVWVKTSAAIPMETFLAAPEYRKYTTCSEDLPRSFAANLGPNQNNGRVTLVPRPTLHGGAADIEIHDASGNKLWTSDTPTNRALEDGRIYAECPRSDPESALWVRAIGDFDGDGRLEILMGADPMFDVAPADFHLLRWNGKVLEYIRQFKLVEAPEATVWQLRREGLDGVITALFARTKGMRGNPDGSIDITMGNWQGPETGVARMRLDKSGDHFTLVRWVRPMGAKNP
ncbi:hypothetical protein LJB81_00080 [Desulfovibrio sp. OttesenSCG-928-M14]|nr:hypothetical protein [Desulfovibrio sp. OttesenSCG-928-M14]